MRVIRTVAEMQEQSRTWMWDGKRIACVPTMGCLHQGHISLINRAATLGDVTVVSIFVNPTQFGPNEDLDAYPRTWDADYRACKSNGVDAIFFPEAAEMYAGDASTWVVEDQLSRPLCGARREGHFKGVTTVVTKLLHAVLPDVAVFGQKDAQQALIIKRMVRDLNFPLDVDIAPIVREADGLAMSSRNRYLSAEERKNATAIHRGLQLAIQFHNDGERSADALIALVTKEIEQSGGKIDYIEIRDAATLETVEDINDPALLAVAAYYGPARLIDNVILP